MHASLHCLLLLSIFLAATHKLTRLLIAKDMKRPASSANSSSDSSTDSLETSSADEVLSGEDDEDLYQGDGCSSEDDVDRPVDRFADLSSACKESRYEGHTVHFWTIPATDKPDRVTASNTTKKELARILKSIYSAAVVLYYCIVVEFHAASARCWERRPHFHVVIKLKRRVKWLRIAAQLRLQGVFGKLSIPKRHAQFWNILSYVYVPSLKKPLTELDPDPFLSSKFPVLEMRRSSGGFWATCSSFGRTTCTRFSANSQQ